MIASDVDGTLLGPSEFPSERTIDVVRRVCADGVPFVLCTGRPPRWIPPVALPLGLTGYAVCANGAVLLDIGSHSVVAVHGSLDPPLLQNLADALDKALPGCRLAAERITADTRAFVIEPEYRNPWGDGEGRSVPRAEVLGHSAIKLLISHAGMNSEEMAVAARAVLDDAVDITYSSSGGLIELSAPGITKATGLADVADRLSVAPDRVIAFGDMPNDVEMLQWAGHGVAMANGHKAALAVADEITGPASEDGVAQVLERWF
ncbi:MAG TPA: HAD family hydrolase [Amycolatopsis sp.]|nr:HAD family hydrolase [Amycolatopsis sp.]